MSRKKKESKKDILDFMQALDDSKPVEKVIAPEVFDDSPKTTAFGRLTSKIYSLEVGEICPRCKYSILEEVPCFGDGKPCEFFIHCPTCNAYICTYRPMIHQKAFHQDETLHKLYAGGFGSAKTYTCGMEFLCTVLQIPGSQGLIGASVWGQVADTCLKFLLDNIPSALVKRSNQDKVNWSITLVNGSKISAKALDSEGKIRSANLSIIWVEEASEVKWNVVTYIAARLRNKVGYFKGKNRLRMLYSSNPDVGWLNTEFLMTSGTITYHGGVEKRYNVDEKRKNYNYSTHIAATSSNIFLPPNYEADLAKNKPNWWVNRYLKGSFEYTEGLVYPEFNSWFVTPFEIPAYWKRITGTDFGRRDPTAHLVAALDPINKIIYVYNEIEEPLEDKPVSYMANKIKSANDYPAHLRPFSHMADPRGAHKDQVSAISWFSAYQDYGIIFQAAKDCGRDSIAPTIQKVSDYASNGKLKIFTNCVKLKESLSKYKYEPKDLGDDTSKGEKPKDANNHLPDALRYLMSVFPMFPTNISEFDYIWGSILERKTIAQKEWSNSFEDTFAEADIFSDFL